MIEDFQHFRNIFDNIVLSEAFKGGHAPHPEDDVVLSGTAGVRSALESISKTLKQPETITIKWDGYPALIFGRGTNKKFSISDKHMFNKKDGSGARIYSPEEFLQYDAARGADRGELTQVIANIWKPLEDASSGTSGYFWGDLLFSKPLKPIDGYFVFKANPNGITYKIQADSDIGKLIQDKQAGIAVHQILDPNVFDEVVQTNTELRATDPRAKQIAATDLARSLNGKLGGLKNNSSVAVLPSAMPYTPKIKQPKEEINQVKAALSKYGKALDDFLSNPPGAGFKSDILVYFNKKIVSGNLQNLMKDFYTFWQDRKMTDSMKKKVEAHLEQHKEGVIALLTIWSAMYNLKMAVYSSMDEAAKQSPVQGYLDNGTQSQEGYVANGYKYVDRLGFSRQNLANR